MTPFIYFIPVIIFIFIGTFFVVKQQTAAVIERFGKFQNFSAFRPTLKNSFDR